MKHTAVIAIAAIVLMVAVAGASANILPAGKATEEIMVGVTGINLKIDEKGVSTVSTVTPARSALRAAARIL